jgi:hypothetical protein
MVFHRLSVRLLLVSVVELVAALWAQETIILLQGTADQVAVAAQPQDKAINLLALASRA